MAIMKEEGIAPTEGFIPGGMGVKGPADLLAYAASITGSKGHEMGKPMDIMHKDPKSMATPFPSIVIDSPNDADGDGDKMAKGNEEGSWPTTTGGV